MRSNKLYSINIFILLMALIISLVVAEFISGKYLETKNKDLSLIEQRGSGRSIRLKLYPQNTVTTVSPHSAAIENTNRSIEKKSYRIIVDEYQSISAPSRKERKDATPIFFLGGSTTEVNFVDEEFRWPILAVKYANNEYGRNYTAFNYGVAGNHLLHNTTVLFAYGRILKPRVVVIQSLMNDMVILSRYGNYLMVNHPVKSFLHDSNQAPTLFYFLLEIKNFFFPNIWELATVAFPRVRELAHSLSPILNHRESKNPKETQNNAKPKLILDMTTPNGLQEIWKRYKKQLKELLTLCSLDNITPIVLIEGVTTDISADHFNGYKRKIREKYGVEFHQVIAAHLELSNRLDFYLRKNNIKSVDLRDLGTGQYMFDLQHYNKPGSIEVAKRVSKSIGGF